MAAIPRQLPHNYVKAFATFARRMARSQQSRRWFRFAKFKWGPVLKDPSQFPHAQKQEDGSVVTWGHPDFGGLSSEVSGLIKGEVVQCHGKRMWVLHADVVPCMRQDLLSQSCLCIPGCVPLEAHLPPPGADTGL